MAFDFAVICEAPLRDKREDRYGQYTSARTAEIAMYKSNQIEPNQIKQSNRPQRCSGGSTYKTHESALIVAVAASCSQSCSHLKGAAAAAGGGFPPPSCLWESRPACPSCDMLEQLPCMRGAFAAPDEMLLCSGVEGPSGEASSCSRYVWHAS